MADSSLIRVPAASGYSKSSLQAPPRTWVARFRTGRRRAEPRVDQFASDLFHGHGVPHTSTPFLQVIGLHEVNVQPEPVHVQWDPPLQSTLHETAAVQSTLHVDFAEQETLTERPACTATAQRLPPLQLALHVLAVAHVKRQSQPFVPQLRVQVVAA